MEAHLLKINTAVSARGEKKKTLKTVVIQNIQSLVMISPNLSN
jgi:hypothetical protein